MPKVVLLPVNGSTADADVFAAALAVGRAFESHFVALHVRPDVKRDIAGLAASDGGMASGIDSMISTMEADAGTREHGASEAWHAFCAQNDIAITDDPSAKGLTSEWVSEVGTEADWIAEYGRTADLIVVGRGEESWGPDYVLMEAALMDTGKPALIAAPSATGEPSSLTGVIGIAWKDTREAAGAVRAALPFLRAATHVTIFTVPDSEDESDKSVLRLAKMLRWHNPNVTVQPLLEHTRPAVEVLLDAATQAGCGLLVMGGYGHSRLREAVFGGFTRTVLESAPLPVLVAH
jgi:nucleotide-binding universal stress UspA family protein